MSVASARIRVWDLPTRLFHWVLALLVVFSFATGKLGGSWLDWHMKSGCAILALLIFRLVWGFIGSETARFGTFVRGPATFIGYARDVMGGRHRASMGHNPMGGWMVVLMLLVLLAQAASGLFADDEIATQGPLAVKASNALVAKMSSFHYYNGWTVAAVVVVHLLAIATYRMAFRQDLIGPMWSGARDFPVGTREPALRAAWIAAIALALCAGVVYWLVAVYPRG